MKVPSAPISQFGTTTRKNADTNLIFGAVFNVCNAARNTFAEELIAPATIPSASPAFTIMHPRNNGFVSNISFASSTVIPLLLRASARMTAYSSIFAQSFGSIKVALLKFKPSAVIIISFLLPIKTIFAISSSNTLCAAITVLLSFVSGSTIVIFCCFARALISSMNPTFTFSFRNHYFIITILEVIYNNQSK